MNRRKRDFKKTGVRFSKKKRLAKIKPGADAGLKKFFADIGIPDNKAFKPDFFQLEAVAAIERADCLVTAPTGAGKTWIAIRIIEKLYKKGGRSWYAAPLKALSNAKYAEFSKIFGPEQVGILTGDRKENPDAPIIVGTTEILRNQLYDAMHIGGTLNADFVVLDEAHFLGDEERGVVWEEIMIYLPSRIQLLLLSATIGNANQIAAWLRSIRFKNCTVVEETKRPVPLVPLFFHPSGTLLPLTTRRNARGKSIMHKKVSSYLSSRHPLLLSPPRQLPPFGQILRVLRKYHLLPAIFFLKSRADCDNALELCMENMQEDSHKGDLLVKRIKELTAQNKNIAQHRQLQHLKDMAVGAHHSGQLPAWKLLLETLMTAGLLDAVFATSTVAAGVNFPARSILFLNSDKFNGKDFLSLTPTEFHQMAGRAGRRGMDKIGFAIAVPGRFMDLRLIIKLTGSPSSDVTSRIKINFSMVLNLLLSHSPDQIENILEKSFAKYLIMQSSKKKVGNPVQSVHKQLLHDFKKHLNFLMEKGYTTRNGELTSDGIWASRLRVDQPLLIAEGFRLGVFPASDPALLAGITALFVYEQEEGNSIKEKHINNNLRQSFMNAKKALEPFAKSMAKRGFVVRPLFFRPAVTLYLWAKGYSWESILPVAEMAEGNLAMLILRTADHLRHIKALNREFPEAAKTAAESIELILRDPVLIV